MDVDSYRSTIGVLSDGSLRQWHWAPSSASFEPIPPTPQGTHALSVSVGETLALALLDNGGLHVWGSISGNWYGQLTAPTLPAGLQFVDCAAGAMHGLAVVSDGTLRAWGSNLDGECNPPALPPGVTWSKVAAHTRLSIGLRSDGQVEVWGKSDHGQQFVPDLPTGLTYTEIDAGWTFVIARRSDGELITWGDNGSFQLAPPALPAGMSWISFDAGTDHMVALRSDGRVFCWGNDLSFQGDIPELPLGRRYAEVACGGGTLIAVLDDGSLQGWGASVNGAVSVPPPGGAPFTQVDASLWFSAGRRSDGSIDVWGWNGHNQQSVPPLPPGVTYTEVACGTGHVLGLRSDGSVVAWGSNSNGQLNVPSLPAGSYYTRIAAYERVNLLLRSDGELATSGISSTWPWITAGPALPPGMRLREIDTGFQLAAGIDLDGNLHVWDNSSQFAAPLPPPGAACVEVACGRRSGFARYSDGSVQTFGSPYQDVTPQPLEPGTSYVRIAAGYHNGAGIVGSESYYVTIHGGCGGSDVSSQLIPHDTPQLGRVLDVSINHLPVNVAFMGFGGQRLKAPISLAVLGVPDCELQIAVDGLVAVTGVDGRATWRLTIPYQPILLGNEFFNQAVVLDPGANASGVVVSEAAGAMIGGSVP